MDLESHAVCFQKGFLAVSFTRDIDFLPSFVPSAWAPRKLRLPVYVILWGHTFSVVISCSDTYLQWVLILYCDFSITNARTGTNDVQDSGSSIAIKSQPFGSVARILCLAGDDSRHVQGKKSPRLEPWRGGKWRSQPSGETSVEVISFVPSRTVCLSPRQKAVLATSKCERNKPTDVIGSLSPRHHRWGAVCIKLEFQPK